MAVVRALLLWGWPLGWIVFARAGAAFAGACVNELENDQAMAAIEVYAKAPKAGARADELDWECAELDAVRLRSRIERACRAVLDRDGIASPCARLAALAGFAKLGKHDLYEMAVKLPEDPIRWEPIRSSPRATLLGRIGDPRGVNVIVETWKEAIPRADKSAARRDSMQAWSVWRQAAAAALGAIAGPEQITFLEEQANTTRDVHVAKACRSAILAIKMRTEPSAHSTVPKRP